MRAYALSGRSRLLSAFVFVLGVAFILPNVVSEDYHGYIVQVVHYRVPAVYHPQSHRLCSTASFWLYSYCKYEWRNVDPAVSNGYYSRSASRLTRPM